MTAALVSCDIEHQVAAIRIDDGKVNAVSHQLIAELGQALDRAEQQARAVVLVGRPGRFSGGFDLGVMTAGPEAMRELVLAGGALFLRLFTFPAPVVVACTGHALAAGAVLLTTADHVVGAEGAFKIGLNEVSIGMPLPIFALELARHRLGPRHLAAATLHARVHDPRAALEAGFLHELVAPEQLEQTALDRARALADALSPPAYQRTKASLRGAIARHVEQTLAEDIAAFAISPTD